MKTVLAEFVPTLRMYVMLASSSIRSQMQHRFNFALGTLLAAIIQLSEFLMIAVLLHKFGAIRGWSMHEIGYLFAVMTLSKTLYRSLANDVHHLEKYLVSGELDQMLTRPAPVLLALMSQNFRFMGGELLQGGAVLVWALLWMTNNGQTTWLALPLTLLVIICGAAILFAIGLATATVGFWTTRISELQTITEDAAQTASRYPLSLYPDWMKSLLLVVLPVGFVNYVPALYILRDELGWWVLALSAAVACFCLAASLRFWRYGLSRYQSAGS